ncbi:hypothetical protein HP456_22575 [Bacillus haikouensis]|jgi:hypothetical protein|uniref:hypothetical protein n=1 Tax=Bacillus haikouensis TaxID=1510468 RepID=UPI0015533F81|nr:hypothetical protein [Bacillus haikouensis]NQD68696.1 hypothetical protein [Bacillus haikouensis]
MFKKSVVVLLCSTMLATPALASASENDLLKNQTDSIKLEVGGDNFTFTTYETDNLKMVKVEDEKGEEQSKAIYNESTDELYINGEKQNPEEVIDFSGLENAELPKISEDGVGTKAIEYPGDPGSSWSYKTSFTKTFSPFALAPTILATLLVSASLDTKTLRNRAMVLTAITGVMALSTSLSKIFKVRVYKRWWDREYPMADRWEYRVIINVYNSKGSFLRGIDFECY